MDLMKMFYKKDDCSKEYNLKETLGKGSFATVKRAVSRADKSDWACKIIEKAKLDAEDEAALKVEVEILQKVEHPAIVKLRQIFDCPKTFYMIMELMTGGELFDRIVEKEKYSEEEARRVVQRLAEGIAYCHDLGIVHRDLKPENLLYTSKSDDAEIKIADFGLAKLLKEDDMMATACGTPGYVAPEILEGGPYTSKVDLWSLGIITYILLCGFPPFYDESNARLFRQIKAAKFDYPSPYWDNVSEEAKDLINHLIVKDPDARFSARDVLEHPFVTGGAARDNDITPALEEMRRFNALRKFRAGVRLARAAIAFKHMAGKSPSERLEAAAEAADEEREAAASATATL